MTDVGGSLAHTLYLLCLLYLSLTLAPNTPNIYFFKMFENNFTGELMWSKPFRAPIHSWVDTPLSTSS